MSLVSIQSAIVRRIQAGDLDSLAELFVRIFPEGEEEEARHYYSHFVMPSEGAAMWVLVAENQIVGALDIVSFHQPIKPCWAASVQYFFTKPEYDTEAWKLLKKAFRFCRAQKIERCYIGVPSRDLEKWTQDHAFSVERIQLQAPYNWSKV